MKTLTDLLPDVPPIPPWVPDWADDVVAGLAIALGLALLITAVWLIYQGAVALVRVAKTTKATREGILTVVAAAIATGVSAQGMWRFSGDVLGFDGPLRFLLFSFIEVAIITSAVRARKNMRENYSAGIDGTAVWALTCLTAVLSSMDARSLPEAIFRLAAPLVAAWLWERGMAIERHRATGRKRINWRLTPERVMVYLGLAETSDRTASQVDTERRLTKVALAADRARALREAGASDRKLRNALTAMHAAYTAAHAHTGLGRDKDLQRALTAEVASLYSSDGLLQVAPASEWMPSQEASDFGRLADETERLRDGLATVAELRAIEANVLMVVANATGQSLGSVTSGVTPAVTHAEVTEQVTESVTNPPFFAPHEWLDEAAGVTSGVTDSVTVERVTDQVTDKVTFDVTDRALFDLRWPPLELSDVTPVVTPGVTADEVTEQVTEEVTATAVMRAYWDANVAKDVYPSPTELAEVGGLRSHSYPSRLRKEWVAELPWRQRLKANAKPKKTAAVNGSKPSS